LLFPLFCIFLNQPKQLHEFKISGFAQGTTYSLGYFATDSIVKKSSIDSIIKVIDQSMSLYQPSSYLSQFNNSTAGSQVDFHLIKVLKRSFEVNKDTEGRFDVTVAPLVQLWGFGPQKITKFPDSDTIKATLPCIGMEKIRLDKLFLHKEKPCIKLDFNGIAQGYTVDVIASYLQAKGINNFIVEVGGELRVKGTKPDGKLFRVGIEGPVNENIKRIIQFKEGAVTTSGNYQKYLMNGKEKISHLIDPKIGYPLKNEMISVTVFAKDAITADGYDNALMAMHVHEAMTFVSKRKYLEAYIIYKMPNGDIADTLSTGFKKMIVN
jgi:thiamine biosynthesis lipoprotein